jgi:hypothetical protein
MFVAGSDNMGLLSWRKASKLNIPILSEDDLHKNA